VTRGAPTVNPDGRGTKCAFLYPVTLPAGAAVGLRLRVAASDASTAFRTEFDDVVAGRHKEADEFYAELTPRAASADEAMVMRQAFSGMLWSKHKYQLILLCREWFQHPAGDDRVDRRPSRTGSRPTEPESF
jgi:hypothetical protein